ncbi:MAG TPA: hypothetical protein VL359_02435, partial [bacterium]|nr:hypothetical protein [bacterium]
MTQPEPPTRTRGRRAVAGLTRAQFLGAAALGIGAAVSGARLSKAAQDARERMATRPIPSSGKALPVVGCGTWRTFDVGPGAAERAPLAEVLRILF